MCDMTPTADTVCHVTQTTVKLRHTTQTKDTVCHMSQTRVKCVTGPRQQCITTQKTMKVCHMTQTIDEMCHMTQTLAVGQCWGQQICYAEESLKIPHRSKSPFTARAERGQLCGGGLKECPALLSRHFVGAANLASAAPTGDNTLGKLDSWRDSAHSSGAGHTTVAFRT